MKHVKVAWKQITILLLGGFGILAVGVFGLFTLRDSVLEERRDKVRHHVEFGYRILTQYGEREVSGELTRADAQRRAINMLRMASTGMPEYFWIMGRDTRFVMHANVPQLEGKTLYERAGEQPVSEIDQFLATSFDEFLSATKRSHSGFVTHHSLKPGTEGAFEKISYFTTYEPWGWKFGAGVYVDDVQRTFVRLAWILGGVACLVFAPVFFGSLLLGRSITVPLTQVAAGLRKLSEGELDVTVPAADRGDELGDVAMAMGAFRDSLHDRERLLRELENSNRVLRESEARYRALTELSPVGVFQADATGDCIYVNARWCEFAGLTPTQAMGKGWIRALHPEDRDRAISEWRRNIELGRIVTSESRFKTADGRVTWLLVQSTALTDGNGRFSGYVGTLTDTTHRRKTEEVLRRAQRMETVTQLTGGIAHDFNNLLGIILGQSEILKLIMGDDARAQASVDTLIKASHRGADLIRRLLSFSRTQPHETQRVSVNEFIRGMEGLIAKSLTPSIRVRAELADDAWPVEIDTGDLEDAILNLALNARDAMPDGGELVIETTNKVLDEAYVAQNPGSTAGRFLMISVSDTGTGMTAEIRDRAFEPFFTMKEEGKGTGLGLSMVYGFVQRSGGHAKIYSEVGRGTVVHLFLPRAQGEAEAVMDGETEPIELPRGDETVLIVDDEESLADIASGFLGNLGYRTLTVLTARDALEVLRKNSEVDLLFSDVIMPGGMDGYELALAAVELKPGLKVLLTSGYSQRREDIDDDDRTVAGGLARTLLHKPYAIADMAVAVRRTLDGDG